MRFKGWIQGRALLFVLSAVAPVVFFTGGTQAAEVARQPEGCVSASEMREIASHFHQFDELAAKGEYCFDDSSTSHLLAGILFMRKTRFAANMIPSRDELFSGEFKNDWYSYFIGRITDFQVEPSCDKGVIAYVFFFGTSMYVCPLALTRNFTALDLASVFMHEARHIDGYPHITCDHGARAGMRGACDTRISDKGSYAVTVETYAQIARYATDLHPALRAYARATALTYADEAFQTEVKIARGRGYLAVTEDQQAHIVRVDGESVTSRDLGRLPEAGRIVPRGQHMILFPEDLAHPARFVFPRGEGDTEQAAGDLAIEYNAQDVSTRAMLRDVHIGATWGVRLNTDTARFTCDPSSNTTSELRLPEAASNFIYPNGYNRGASAITMVSVSGTLYELGCGADRTPFVRASTLKLDQAYARVFKSGETTVGLTRAGRLVRVTEQRSEALALPFNGRVRELVPYDDVEFFDASL